ncbi:MAG TPA: ATP-binding protein [Gammaproteobacteria bacterium]|jgi:signal transduction histidine kinase|nr:ATP-binding protein [Gammaproteobacteria bacterium]
MRAFSPDLHEMYRKALNQYLNQGGEAPLLEAYELGRQALGSGVGVLGLINIHHSALAALLDSPGGDVRQKLDDSHRFLMESMSPFEMMQIGNQESNAALRRLNGILEEEAKRIAHTLHDEAAQMLASAYLELAEIERLEPPQAVREHVEHISAHLDEVSDQLRRLSHELRPPILDQLGLMPALTFLSDGFRKRAGLEIDIANEIAEHGRLPQPVETALYRTVQEALNNVVKHAQARRVGIRVWIEDHLVYCSIKDDGKGFATPAGSETGSHGLGLLGIRERISSLHGAFEVESKPGAGTELRIGIPLGSNL